MLADIARLKRMRWSELEREALEVGLPVRVISEAATLDELRLEILKKLNPKVEELADAV